MGWEALGRAVEGGEGGKRSFKCEFGVDHVGGERSGYAAHPSGRGAVRESSRNGKGGGKRHEHEFPGGDKRGYKPIPVGASWERGAEWKKAVQKCKQVIYLGT